MVNITQFVKKPVEENKIEPVKIDMTEEQFLSALHNFIGKEGKFEVSKNGVGDTYIYVTFFYKKCHLNRNYFFSNYHFREDRMGWRNLYRYICEDLNNIKQEKDLEFYEMPENVREFFISCLYQNHCYTNNITYDERLLVLKWLQKGIK